MTDSAPTLADAARTAAEKIKADYGDIMDIDDLIAIAYMRGNVAGIREALASIKQPVEVQS